MFKKLKKKISDKWNKFKKFYQRNYKKRKPLTITLTVLAALISPLVVMLIVYLLMFIIGLVVMFFTFWFIYKITIGSGKKTSTSTSEKKSSAVKYYGYSEEDIFAIIDTEPKLRMNKYADWPKLAEALDESKYTKEIKVMYAGKLPIYIFPKDKKPRISSHFFKENMVESGGGIIAKAEEHFTEAELKSGEICIVHNEKRLTAHNIHNM